MVYLKIISDTVSFSKCSYELIDVQSIFLTGWQAAVYDIVQHIFRLSGEFLREPSRKGLQNLITIKKDFGMIMRIFVVVLSLFNVVSVVA